MNMPDFTSAEGALSRELVRFEGLTALRDVFTNLGSLQQATTEAQTRADAARAAEAAAQSDLAEILRQVSEAKAAAATAIAEAQASVAAVLAKANDDAAAIVAAAREQADKIISDAANATADSKRRAQLLADAIQQAGT
jgi:hypothetical protein